MQSGDTDSYGLACSLPGRLEGDPRGKAPRQGVAALLHHGQRRPLLISGDRVVRALSYMCMHRLAMAVFLLMYQDHVLLLFHIVSKHKPTSVV